MLRVDIYSVLWYNTNVSIHSCKGVSALDTIILGTVTIDTNCNILDYNEAAATAIPRVTVAKKCYQAFLNKEEPCVFCPLLKEECHKEVANKAASESNMKLTLPDGEQLHIVSFIIDKKNNKPNLSCLKYNLADYKKDRRVLKEASEKDKTTGLYTRDAFVKYSEQLLKEHPAESYNLTIVRIKNYQVLSATYGEERVRELIKAFADYSSNMCDSGIIGRYSVDQFVMLYQSPSLVRRLAFLKAFKEFFVTSSIANAVVNYGIYEHVDHNSSIDSMCSKALAALNSIKDYRRTFVLYSDKITQNEMKAQTYESWFTDALKQKEFTVWYQPKFDANSERIVGAEALVRWQSKQGLIAPGEFLPIFESDGLIAELDRYVFEQVCLQQKRWQDEGRGLFPISVNISRNSLFTRDVVYRYKTIVNEYGIDPKYVPIEITESVALENIQIKPIADAFISAGFSLHMDDFGSGRSSLNGLNMLNFEVVKLDKSLIDFIGQENGELILDHTIALGKELGVILVAEGVETNAQLEFLKSRGCQVIQGFYYSKPLPLDEFEQKLKEKGFERLEDYLKYTVSTRIPSFNVAHLYEHMPGGFFCYEAFGEERILSSNSYLWRMFGFDNEADFMEHVHGSFKGIVCPEELDTVEESITSQINNSAREMDFVKYHIIHRDGHRLPVVDYGHLSHRKDDAVFYVFVHEDR